MLYLCSLTVARFNILPRGVSYDDPAGLAIVAGHIATQWGRASRADTRLHMALGLNPDQGAPLKFEAVGSELLVPRTAQAQRATFSARLRAQFFSASW